MKKICFILVCVSMLILSVSACSSADESTGSNADTAEITTDNDFVAEKSTIEGSSFDLEAYKASVQACREDMYENATAINNVINYVINWATAYTNIGGTDFDIDSTVEKGFTNMEEKGNASREDVVALHETIRDEYASLIITDIEGNEAEELDSALRDMYDNYNNLYELLSTTFSDVDDYSAARNEYINALVVADDDLGLFLD